MQNDFSSITRTVIQSSTPSSPSLDSPKLSRASSSSFGEIMAQIAQKIDAANDKVNLTTLEARIGKGESILYQELLTYQRSMQSVHLAVEFGSKLAEGVQSITRRLQNA